MTLREINTVLREDELNGDPPLDRLMGILAILRSLEQGEPCTMEGATASTEKFIEVFGRPSTELVDMLIKRIPDALLDVPVPYKQILDTLLLES